MTAAQSPIMPRLNAFLSHFRVRNNPKTKQMISTGSNGIKMYIPAKTSLQAPPAIEMAPPIKRRKTPIKKSIPPINVSLNSFIPTLFDLLRLW